MRCIEHDTNHSYNCYRISESLFTYYHIHIHHKHIHIKYQYIPLIGGPTTMSIYYNNMEYEPSIMLMVLENVGFGTLKSVLILYLRMCV